MVTYTVSIHAQQQNQQEQFITVIGDSLMGKMIGGESIREVYGHVILTQGKLVITCDKAVQYLASNNADLLGNVIAKQDTLTILTPHAFYFGNERHSKSVSGVTLNDTKVILTADSGDYFFKEDRAFFQGNVKMYDTATTLTSKEMTYYKLQNRMVAVNNVKIVDSTNVIEADSLEHFRATRISFANRNVKITNTGNNTVIYGDHLEDYAQRAYTLVNKNPLLIQIDSSYTNDSTANKNSNKNSRNVSGSKSMLTNNDSTLVHVDTLLIRSNIMEAYRDTINRFEATDSVRILRGAFASVNDYTIYFRKQERIVTKKMGDKRPQPIMWNENTQMTGDSIAIHLHNNRIRLLDVIGNGFLLSQNEIYKKRYDQISGDKIFISFDSSGITSTEVKGSVLSIYFMYENDSTNGLTKSSGQNAMILFKERKVSTVKLFVFPKSDYYPEKLVENKELSFTLPGYVIFTNRPTKKDLLYK
ncbi:MAG: OstA-like protein [Ignavibacteriaceae bacterium]|nr:OstA-like protein [Ignavibacteriaceae bacterium]